MIRALIVDDSSFMRKSLKYILETDPSLEVAGMASDGEEAIRMVKQVRPDVVLLDVAMPVMDGLTALAHIMVECPTPVVVLSGVKDARIAIKSLEQGAVDFIKKPSGTISYDIDDLSSEIVARVKVAATVDIRKLQISLTQMAQSVPTANSTIRKEMVVIGASTGGAMAVANILSSIPAGIKAAMLIVQHMGPDFIPSFAERLRWLSPLAIDIAGEGEALYPGRVLIAPGDCNATVVKIGNVPRIALDRNSSPLGLFPSVDSAMESAARVFGAGVLGVLLSGMGSYGAKGMQAIKAAGGDTIAQDEASCIVFGMPWAAIEAGCVDEVLPLGRIAERILARI